MVGQLITVMELLYIDLQHNSKQTDLDCDSVIWLSLSDFPVNATTTFTIQY
jgi:hypothetical protein